jgi:hypothetical protein
MFHNIVDTLYNLRLERRIYNGYKRYKNNEEEIQLRKLKIGYINGLSGRSQYNLIWATAREDLTPIFF